MSQKQNQSVPNRGAGACRVETLARDIFAGMVGNHWNGMSLEHLAKTAQEAAEAFYKTWDRLHGERS
jgi:hypothetical protein